MKEFELRVLGTFHLAAGADSRPLRSQKAQALLTYLALRPLQTHRRDAVASLLWGRVTASQARHSLRQTISFIRQSLEDVATPLILSEFDTIRLNVPAVSVDALRFAELAHGGLPPDLRAATEAYVGELLEGVHLNENGFDNWLASERARLHHLAIEVFSRQLQYFVETGPVEDAIGSALRLLALDPLLEWVHRALMQLYEKQGRHGAALQQYNQCARVIQQELGIEPDTETRRVYDAILARRARSAPVSLALPSRAAARPSGPDGDSLPESDPPALPRASVVVVRATAVTGAMLERVLVPAGYALVVVRTLAEALALVQRLTNPIVVTADDSRRRRGEVITAVRAQRQDVPVVVITTESPQLPPSSEPRLGYVRRPIRAEALLDTIAGLLGQSQHPRSNG
jgi:DNA-binding SARP family transcriptional activator/CheY-like chemotaxis protein